MNKIKVIIIEKWKNFELKLIQILKHNKMILLNKTKKNENKNFISIIYMLLNKEHNIILLIMIFINKQKK